MSPRLRRRPRELSPGPSGQPVAKGKVALEEVVSSNLTRSPVFHRAVNKRLQSTGETREFAPEILVPEAEPGGLLAPSRHRGFATEDVGTVKYVRNVWDIGDTGNGCCPAKRWEFVTRRHGSPQNSVSNDLSGAQVIESKRRMDGDKRGALDSHFRHEDGRSRCSLASIKYLIVVPCACGTEGPKPEDSA
jgi:hypothetical protein